MSLNLSLSSPTLTLSSRRQPSSLKRALSQSPYPRAYSNSSTSNIYSYLADLEYPEEGKRSFDNSVRNKITFTECPPTALGSSWTDVGDRPGKKPKLGDYYYENNDADYHSQIGYAVPAKPFRRSYAYPTSEERTNWWDDDEVEADKDDSSDDVGNSTWDEVVEDQVQSTVIDPPRGRTISPSRLGGVSSISRRSHSADLPPPETPQYKLWNEGEEDEDERYSACSLDSAPTDLANEEGFKAYFDMVEAGSSSSKDRHTRRRSKSLTPPASPPKTNGCELLDHSIGGIAQGNTQAESSDYSIAPAELEEQEGDSMDVEFPCIYSPGTLSENNGSFKFGPTATQEPFGLELYGAGPPNPSPYDAVPNFGYFPQVPQFFPSFVYPVIPIEVGQGNDENGDGEVPDVTSILNPEAFQEAPEGMEDDDLWNADHELMRRNLNARNHIDRFFMRIGSQPAQGRRDRNAPRPYSKLGFYPPLFAVDLPRYLEQEDEEAEAEAGRSNTSGSSSWSDLDGDEDDDYFKELPLFA